MGVEGLVFRVWGLGLRVYTWHPPAVARPFTAWFRVRVLRLRVSGFGFRVWGLGFGFGGSGFRGQI